MAPKTSSLNPLDWGSGRIKSQRSLGKLRSRVEKLRSATQNRSDPNTDSQSAHPDLPTKETTSIFKLEPRAEPNAAGNGQQDSTDDNRRQKLQDVASFLGNSTTAYSVSGSEATEPAATTKPTENVTRPPSVISQTFSVGLASQADYRSSSRAPGRVASSQ
jgi:hypothetical protein